MNAGFVKEALVLVGALLLCGVRVHAQDAEVATFEIDVTSSSLSSPQFQPFTFDQTWTLTGWSSPDPELDDVGNGDILTKATAGAATVASATPVTSQVLVAANIPANELGQGFYAENGVYSAGGGDADLRFENQATELVPNGDGTYQYENYDETLYYNFGYTSPVVALTPSVIGSYLAADPTTSWSESGSDYLDPNSFTLGTELSSLSYSGTATFLGLEDVPEPGTTPLLFAGGLLAVLARRFAAAIR